jgi:glycosyltransferase involved in cell wall biosynthesis
VSSVDVVIPCYNYARYLPRCVQSVLDQEGVDVRVLVIDDTSPDNTPEVGKQLAAADSRVEFRRHEINKGHIATYNEGLLGWAKADYCLLLSADDMLAPGALLRATRLMDANPDVHLTYGMALIINSDPNDVPNTDNQPDDHQILTGAGFIERCCSVCNPVPTPCAVVRTSMQQKLGGYKPELPHTGDMEMWMRFAVHGRVGVLRAVQGFYRVHGKNMSVNYNATVIRDRREQLQACTDVFNRWGAQIPGFDRWVKDMIRRFGQEAFWLGSLAFDAGDDESCRRCLDFAVEFDPAIQKSQAWRRLKMKRAIGPALWKLLRPVYDRLRGIREAPFAPPSLQTGWWPRVS